MDGKHIDNTLHNYSFLVILDIPTKNKWHLLDTRKDTLDLRNKNIKAILPRTLMHLHTYNLNISNNKLLFLPSIHSLRILQCDNCDLRELPSLPNIQDLSCSNNLLTKLPIYKNAININCSKNFIKFLDLQLYPKLKRLNCSCNMITDLGNHKILSVNATNCPILTVYYNFSGYRRSGVIKNGKFIWVSEDTTKYTVINWQTATTTLVPTSKFAKKLFKFLFNV